MIYKFWSKAELAIRFEINRETLGLRLKKNSKD